jgi:hypothetical protein
VYSTNLPFIIEGETKAFYNKKLMEFTTTKPVLQKIHKGILHTEEEDKCKYRKE